MGTAIAILGLVGFVGGIVLLFRKGRRKIGAAVAVLSFFVFTIGAVIGGGEVQDEKARAAGFDTYAEYQKATTAGFTDGAAWRAELDRQKAATAAAAAEAAAAEQRKKDQADTACRTDLQCWGDRNLGAATGPCTRAVERLAKNSHKWVDEWLQTKFSRFRWSTADKTRLTYIGDRIQYQNGFGAWINHVYECDFDPATRRVVDARAEAGRLPE